MKTFYMLYLLIVYNLQGSYYMLKKLAPAPKKIDQFHEIATQYNDQLPDLWNNLMPEERIFIYYIYRASIPGNRIIADQTHRHSILIIDIFEQIVKHKKLIKKHGHNILDVETFLKEAELFLIYLYAHHGHYFLKEYENHKRTPHCLNLSLITPKNLSLALEIISMPNTITVLNALHDSIFDPTYEPTILIADSIEQSAGNLYSHDFTQKDYDQMTSKDKSAINSYFYIEHKDGKRIPNVTHYKIGGKYSQELEIAHFWLEKALEQAKKYPNIFDQHIPASLECMLHYLETGDEQYFKEFSKHWLKTNSRIDFNFGFIEVYQDPKQTRGSFEADITIKIVDMKKLNAILPDLEQQLPFPEAFKRDDLNDLAKIPNASINAKIFASGDSGPVKILAAYCLPNYEDIRAEHGSKQIMYQSWKSLGELINPELALNLFTIKDQAAWIRTFDPQRNLQTDIYDALTILHETIGHASGKLATHTFVNGDDLTIDGKIYNIDDIIPVTHTNITQLLPKYLSGLEELRAEIIALYISIFHFDELAAQGLFKNWPQKIGKETLIKWLIIHMAQTGFSRLINQQEDTQEIAQAHPQANMAILNYLLDHGGLKLVEETYTYNNKDYTVIGVHIIDLSKALEAIRTLTIEVQRIKSTADNQALQKLMKNYGASIRYPRYIKTLKINRQVIQGDLKEIAEIFPHLTPVFDDKGVIIDISAEWPENFLEQYLSFSELALSKK